MLDNFKGYIKKGWKNAPDKSTPLSADNLDYMDSGIKNNADAIKEIAGAISQKLENNSEKIPTMNLLFEVNKNAKEDSKNAADIANEAKGVAESAIGNFSDKYVKKTYKKGETCIQDNVLYEANADINTAEDWNAAHWTETSVEKIRAKMRQELDVVNANIANIAPDDTAVGGKPWTSKHIVDMLCPPLEVSGNPVQCYPVPGYPLGITASWEPTQEGTGDPSPDNIRPIKGRDSVTVWRFGQNLLNYEAFKGTPVISGTAVYENNGVTLTARKNDCYTAWTQKDGFPEECKIPVVPGETITLSWDEDTNKKGIVFIFPNGIAKGGANDNNASTKSISYTVEAGVSFVTFRFGVANAGDTISYKNIQCIIGSEAPTEYQPYTGDTVTLALPETICAGTVDAVTGEGLKQWALITIDGTESIDSYRTSEDTDTYKGFLVRVYAKNVFSTAEEVCSHLKGGLSTSTGYFPNTFLLHTNGNLYVRMEYSGIISVDDFKKYLADQYAAGTPFQVAYRLAVPTAFSATGNTPGPALSGINTVLTDADSVDVTGREDLLHAISSVQAVE